MDVPPTPIGTGVWAVGRISSMARPASVRTEIVGAAGAPTSSHVVAGTSAGCAYGPATITNFRSWLTRGRVSARQIRKWFDAVGDRLTEVRVDGHRVHILAEHVDELAATRPTDALRLLPGFDQYVLGLGTEEGSVIPPKRRRDVSRQSGWIAPIVVASGVVKGTWEIDGGRVRIGWFREAGRPPRGRIDAEVARLAAILDQDLGSEIHLA